MEGRVSLSHTRDVCQGPRMGSNRRKLAVQVVELRLILVLPRTFHCEVREGPPFLSACWFCEGRPAYSSRCCLTVVVRPTVI